MEKKNYQPLTLTHELIEKWRMFWNSILTDELWFDLVISNLLYVHLAKHKSMIVEEMFE